MTELLNDVAAQAEIQSITAAANYLGGKYLKEFTLYVSLEPYKMCAGALYWSQITKIVLERETNNVVLWFWEQNCIPKLRSFLEL